MLGDGKGFGGDEGDVWIVDVVNGLGWDVAVDEL